MVFVVQMVCNAAQASRNDVFVILADLLGIVAVSRFVTGCIATLKNLYTMTLWLM